MGERLQPKQRTANIQHRKFRRREDDIFEKGFARPEKDLRTSTRERGTSAWRERSGGWQTAADISGFLPKAATRFRNGRYCLITPFRL
jgi:hypothetical protein